MKNKILKISLVVTLLLALSIGVFTVMGSDNYTTISTADEFMRMTSNGKYKLSKDIDFAGVNYTPIALFEGELDGAGYTVKNLTITQNTADELYTAVVSVNKGEIKNIKFDNVTVNATSSNGAYAAVVAGTNQGYISSVTITNSSVAATSQYGVARAGGVAALNTGVAELKDCSVDVETKATSSVNAKSDKIVGMNLGNVVNCKVVTPSVSGNEVSVPTNEAGNPTFPEAEQKAGALFIGWTDASGNTVKSTDTFTANSTVKLTPKYLEISDDILSGKVDEAGNTNDQNPVDKNAVYQNAMYLQGAQVRLPVKENKTLALRFITVNNTDLGAELKNAGIAFERGMLVARGDSFKGELVMGAQNAIVVPAQKLFAPTSTLGKNYDKYTVGVYNIPDKYIATDIIVRPYYSYTDLSGATQTLYGEQYACSLLDAAQAAYDAKDEGGNYIESDSAREALKAIIDKAK